MARKRHKLSPEHKEKLRKANLGRKMPEAEKKKISESKRQRAREIQEEMPYVLPVKKRCTACKKIKLVETDFSLRKVKLKSGIERLAVETRCRKCIAIATKEWRERKRAEGTLHEIQKGYRDNFTPEQKDSRREYNREYQTIKRREKGAKARGALRPGDEPRVDRMPLVKFIEEEMDRTGINKQRIHLNGGPKPSVTTYLLQGWEPAKKTKKGRTDLSMISLHMVDMALRGLDREDMLTILYPDEKVVNAIS